MGDIQRLQRAPDVKLGLALHPDVHLLVHCIKGLQEAILIRYRSYGDLGGKGLHDVLILPRVVSSSILKGPYSIMNVHWKTAQGAIHLRPLGVDVLFIVGRCFRCMGRFCGVVEEGEWNGRKRSSLV